MRKNKNIFILLGVFCGLLILTSTVYYFTSGKFHRVADEVDDIPIITLTDKEKDDFYDNFFEPLFKEYMDINSNMSKEFLDVQLLRYFYNLKSPDGTLKTKLAKVLALKNYARLQAQMYVNKLITPMIIDIAATNRKPVYYEREQIIKSGGVSRYNFDSYIEQQKNIFANKNPGACNAIQSFKDKGVKFVYGNVDIYDSELTVQNISEDPCLQYAARLFFGSENVESAIKKRAPIIYGNYVITWSKQLKQGPIVYDDNVIRLSKGVVNLASAEFNDGWSGQVTIFRKILEQDENFKKKYGYDPQLVNRDSDIMHYRRQVGEYFKSLYNSLNHTVLTLEEFNEVLLYIKTLFSMSLQRYQDTIKAVAGRVLSPTDQESIDLRKFNYRATSCITALQQLGFPYEVEQQPGETEHPVGLKELFEQVGSLNTVSGQVLDAKIDTCNTLITELVILTIATPTLVVAGSAFLAGLATTAATTTAATIPTTVGASATVTITAMLKMSAYFTVISTICTGLILPVAYSIATASVYKDMDFMNILAQNFIHMSYNSLTQAPFVFLTTFAFLSGFEIVGLGFGVGYATTAALLGGTTFSLPAMTYSSLLVMHYLFTIHCILDMKKSVLNNTEVASTEYENMIQAYRNYESASSDNKDIYWQKYLESKENFLKGVIDAGVDVFFLFGILKSTGKEITSIREKLKTFDKLTDSETMEAMKLYKKLITENVRSKEFDEHINNISGMEKQYRIKNEIDKMKERQELSRLGCVY